MNATEARAYAKSIYENVTDNTPEVKKILDAIKNHIAANKPNPANRITVYYYETIPVHIRSYLENKGYKIENHSDQREGTLMYIMF